MNGKEPEIPISALKTKATDHLKTTPNIKITLLYLLSTLGLSFLINHIIPDEFFVALSEGNPAVFNDTGILYLFLIVLTTAFGWLMKFGYTKWILRTTQGESPPPSTLLEGFAHTDKILQLQLQKITLTVCWFCSFLLAFSFFSTPFFLFPSLTGIMLLSIFPIILCFLFWLYLRYAFASFYFLEKPEDGIFKSLKNSVKLQKEHGTPLIKLHLTFIPWLFAFLLATLGYNGLNFFLNSLTSEADFASLLFHYNPVAHGIFLLVEWILLLKFLPLYYTALAFFYQDVNKYKISSLGW